MGAKKTHQYSESELKSASIANALSHPARIRILNILKHEPYVRNVDLVKELELVKSTVNTHLYKLKNAELVDLEFKSNCYLVRPNHREIQKIPFLFDTLN
jgi:predicted transcriptional regulator